MDLEQKAIERLRTASKMSLAYYNQPLIITYSGGKDSDVLLELTKRSGIPFQASHSHTTADAPQTIYHIRKVLYNLELQGIKCNIFYPMYKGKRTSMWDLIVQKGMPPTRIVRYCCDVLKEQTEKNRMIATGVRWEESNNRKKNRGLLEDMHRNKDKRIILTHDNDDKRLVIERCELKVKTICNPIVDWTTKDIWNFKHSEGIEFNPLYNMGFDRVGCIGCPMSDKKRYFQFNMFPKYRDMYIRAFDRMLLQKSNCTTWKTGKDVFGWWMNEDSNQMTFDAMEV